MFAMFHPEGSKKDVDRWRQREECKLLLHVSTSTMSLSRRYILRHTCIDLLNLLHGAWIIFNKISGPTGS